MSEKFVKIFVEDELPQKEGKYIVFTKTPMGNVNIFEATLHLRTKKGKTIAHWGCSNQIVTHWLKSDKI